jgi:hypothetical protein
LTEFFLQPYQVYYEFNEAADLVAKWLGSVEGGGKAHPNVCSRRFEFE